MTVSLPSVESAERQSWRFVQVARALSLSLRNLVFVRVDGRCALCALTCFGRAETARCRAHTRFENGIVTNTASVTPKMAATVRRPFVECTASKT